MGRNQLLISAIVTLLIVVSLSLAWGWPWWVPALAAVLVVGAVYLRVTDGKGQR